MYFGWLLNLFSSSLGICPNILLKPLLSYFLKLFSCWVYQNKHTSKKNSHSVLSSMWNQLYDIRTKVFIVAVPSDCLTAIDQLNLQCSKTVTQIKNLLKTEKTFAYVSDSEGKVCIILCRFMVNASDICVRIFFFYYPKCCN